MGLAPRDLLREKDPLYAANALADPKWSDDELIGFMLANRTLINRPIVVTPRPPGSAGRPRRCWTSFPDPSRAPSTTRPQRAPRFILAEARPPRSNDMSAIIRPKDAYHEQTSRNMEKFLHVPPWTIQQKIALTCRILATEGHESALAGQITARGEKPGTYWMLSFGLGFDEAMASNIVLVDDDLNLLEGEGMVNPSNRFHLWIYRHRPNVNAIIHTHPPYISALSLVGEPLVAAHMDTTMFFDDCAHLPEWPGVPIGDEEGRIILEALGDKRAILLAHHGQLVATRRSRKAACSGCSSSAPRGCRCWRARSARSRLSIPTMRARRTTTGSSPRPSAEPSTTLHGAS